MDWIAGGAVLLCLVAVLLYLPTYLPRAILVPLQQGPIWLLFLNIAWPLLVVFSLVWATLALFGII